MCPDRMCASGTFASADSSRMVISDLLISNEKIADVIPFLMEQARAKSNPSVELCVGTIDRLARYMWSSLSTCTHRTGTLATGRTSTTYRRSAVRTEPFCRASLRASRNTGSVGVKQTE